MTGLGYLERVDSRETWPDEAGSFTPWLAGEENIKLLGDTIGIELEVEAQEENVGPFRADILCKDTANNHWVLIENQLEKTDHTHLGQLMTYAAGLDAVSIIWIAEQFTDEHRAAIDWINEITEEGINFFGLEIELWRIDNSPVAPKFNIISKPNEWSKTVKTTAGKRELSDTKRLQLKYWTALHNFLIERKGPVRPHSPRPQHWMNFALGSSKCHMAGAVNTQKSRIRVSIICTGATAGAYFNLLKEDREAIEKEIGSELQWDELPEKKESRIRLAKNADPTNEQDWPNQHKWLAEKLEIFYKTFSTRVKKIDPSEYEELIEQESNEDENCETS